jgi:hypothetical protein
MGVEVWQFTFTLSVGGRWGVQVELPLKEQEVDEFVIVGHREFESRIWEGWGSPKHTGQQGNIQIVPGLEKLDSPATRFS